MLAQVTLTPTESKKLIAKAVVQTDEVKKAAKKGAIVIHPCSTNFFVFEELTGHKPPTEVWSCGITVPKGECTEIGTVLADLQTRGASHDPREYLYQWIIRQGEYSWGRKLGEIMDEMTPDSVYIKGANAIDTEGTVAVLVASPSEPVGGNIAVVMDASRERGFPVIFAVGLEKLIPGRIKEIYREARQKEYSYTMGIRCALLPLEGIVITEVNAIRILSGATAIPIAAGGIGGAEGALVLVIKGEDNQVRKAIEYVEQSKGAKLPEVRTRRCDECPAPEWGICFSLSGKHWVI